MRLLRSPPFSVWGSLSHTSAYGPSPLLSSSSFLSSFGLKYELDCRRVCYARGCVPVGRQGSSPNQMRHPRCALSRGGAGAPCCGVARGGLCPFGPHPWLPREGLWTEEEVVVSQAGCPPPQADSYLTHIRGSPDKGRGPGPPVLSRAMQIVGVRQRRLVPVSGQRLF